MIYRTRPSIGIRYATRHAPDFPQQEPPAAFFSGLDRPLGRSMQAGTHRVFLSENLQLPFLADSTGHWSAICKPVRTGFSSAKASSCLFGGLDQTSGRETQAGIPGPLKSVPLCGTPYFFTIHSSLFTQLSLVAGFPCRRAFYFFCSFCISHIDIHLSMRYTLT